MTKRYIPKKGLEHRIYWTLESVHHSLQAAKLYGESGNQYMKHLFLDGAERSLDQALSLIAAGSNPTQVD